MSSVLDQINSEIAVLSQLSSTGDGSGYGVDLVCVTDLDSRLAETDPASIASLSQDLFHRITTARGSLQDDPDYGFDVRAKLSVGQTPQQIQALQGQLEGECRKDDRVADIRVSVVISGARLDSWTITLAVLPQDPALTSFSLIVAVTSGEALLLETQNARN